MKAVRLVAGVAAAALSLSTSALGAERLPTFPKRTHYAEARTSLLALGWKPVEQSSTFCENGDCGLTRCFPNDQRCASYPETEICRGTGQAACQFIWQKNQTLIEVRAIGEDFPQGVAGVRCRVNCR